jgi:integrase
LLAVSPPWLHRAIVWAIDTGMRRGEILSLRRADIQGGRLALLRSTKNGRARAVPLSSRARALLSDLPASGLLFPVSGNEMSYYWRKACEDAGVKGLRYHDLRHEAISRFFEKGLSTEEVMTISGHSTYTMLWRYTHLKVSNIAKKLD